MDTSLKSFQEIVEVKIATQEYVYTKAHLVILMLVVHKE